MRDELHRQLARRRTWLLLGAMVLIPIALGLIYVVRGAPELVQGATPQLTHLAPTSALAFATFVLYLCAPLLLVAIAAAFTGDALASESAWGTLRYLLAAPIPRRRLLARKLAAGLVLASLATLLLVATSLAFGALAFGWDPLLTPVGGTLDPSSGAARLAWSTAYVLVTLAPFSAFALLFATLLDTPLGAVGVSTGIAVVGQILDSVPSLGGARVVLPTHYAYAWTDWFVDPPLPDDLAAGVLQSVAYSVAACLLAWWRFSGRDIAG
ncbi:MAG: transporter permease [Thermoleophilia bacterium]|nr:transporter permease [Thermoleophilia bacterium]